MRRITWPAVGGVIVTVAALVYFYLALNGGHTGGLGALHLRCTTVPRACPPPCS